MSLSVIRYDNDCFESAWGKQTPDSSTSSSTGAQEETSESEETAASLDQEAEDDAES